MRVYLDVCCLNRPFDDLSQDRVNLEAEAVLSIVSRCEKGEWSLVASGAIDFELSQSSDFDRLEQVRTLYSAANERVRFTEETEQRAALFRQSGIKDFDSLHLALAESGGVDAFLTTDDRLLRAVQQLDLKIKVANPVSWLMEVIKNER